MAPPNGSFVDGERIQEVVLPFNQTFQLGEIQLQLISRQPVNATTLGLRRAASAPDKPLPTVGAHCKTHPRALARHVCPRCREGFCDLCVNTRRERGSARKHCRVCDALCEPLEVTALAPQKPRGFVAQLPGALVYPLLGNGPVLLIGGGVFFLLLGWMPLIGLLVTGYLFSYTKRIVSSSASGENSPPDWPDFTNWLEDMIMPYFQLAALVILTFGPSLVLAALLPPELAGRSVIIVAVAVIGAFLAPIGMLALSMFDTITALNPISFVWSIGRIPLHYVVAAIAFGFVIGAYLLVEDALASLIPVPFLGYIISGFLNLYLLSVAMRILGLLYQARKEDLGWHSSRSRSLN